MVFSLGKTAFLLLLALLLSVSFAEIVDDEVDIEDVDDIDLKEAVRQEEEGPGGGNPEEAAPSGPQAAFRGPPPATRVCGVFILCERGSGFFGGPSAQLIQSATGTVSVRTVGRCRTVGVRGKCKRRTRINHARLWPIFGEEFNELCFYRERKHACFTGKVQVIKKVGPGPPSVEYECAPTFDAMSVQFCMYRNPNDC